MQPLTTRAAINIGTWNVRKIWEIRRTIQLATEMRRYNLAVLRMSETNRTQTRQKILHSKEVLLFSGHEEILLHKPSTLKPPDIEAAHTDYPIDVTPPTIEEIRMVTRQTTSGKAAGPDNTSAEPLNQNSQCSSSLYSSRPQHTQWKNEDPQIQQGEHQPPLDGEALETTASSSMNNEDLT
ncbi:unnamed protein product [Schistosoma margrebowiei]|uniref:Uncharacterized protein n=1 Tax=Schistosoma margrebowiei TaxID=48269 RepID=A0A183MVG2_9TREM|nr:unnamed protein product [Schistosoma margrebowiei]